MHDSTGSLYREYWENVESKIYHSGFFMLTKKLSKPCKKFGLAKEYATSNFGGRKLQATRVYAELRGTILFYWEAGHCDIDPGTVARLKNSTEAKQISIITCEPGFKEEERDPANQRTSFLCISFDAPKESYELLVNRDGIPYCYQFAFSNYQQCTRFFTCAQLAIAESYWLQSLHSKTLIAQTKENSPAGVAKMRLISTFILEICRDCKLVQGYAKVVKVKRGKNKHNAPNCAVEIYADESGKKLIGTIQKWSCVYLQIFSKDSMYKMIMQDATWKRSGNRKNASKISLPETNLSLQFESSEMSDLVELMECIMQPAHLPPEGLELPECLPNDGKRMFLTPTECNIDVLFHSRTEINRTFLMLFRTSKSQTIPITGYAALQGGNEFEVETRESSGSSDKNVQLSEKKRRSRLSIYSLNNLKVAKSDVSLTNTNSQEQRNSLTSSGSGLLRPKSRISMYFRENGTPKADGSQLFSGGTSTNSMQNIKLDTSRQPELGSTKSPQSASVLCQTPLSNNPVLGQRVVQPTVTSTGASPSMQQRGSMYFGLPPQFTPHKPGEFYPQMHMINSQSPMMGYYGIAGQPGMQPNGAYTNNQSAAVRNQQYFPIGNFIPPGYSSPALFPLNQFSYANGGGHPQHSNANWINQNQFSLPTQTAAPFSGHPYYAY